MADGCFEPKVSICGDAANVSFTKYIQKPDKNWRWFCKQLFQRVMGWMAEELGRDPEELKGQVYLIPPCALKVDNKWDVKAITALLKEVDPAILFLDPLIRYHDQEENSNTDMQAAIRPLAELGRKWSVCVVHHSPIERPGDLRGGGDIRASYKSLWKVTGKEGDTRSIRVKPVLKAGPQPAEFKVGYLFDDANDRLVIWSNKGGSRGS